MKTILTLLMLFLSIGAFSQTSDTTSVGDEFIKFERQFSNGKTVMLVGVTLVVAGSAIVATPVIITGSIAILIGEVIASDSFKHIRFAGILMNQNHIGTKIKPIE